MIFLFVAAFMDKTLGNFQNPGLTKLHTIHFDIVKLLLYNISETITGVNMLLDLNKEFGMLKTCTKEMFHHLEDVNWFALKRYMFDRIVEVFSRFRDLA